MPNYHFTYTSTTALPDDPEAAAGIMQAWQAWFTDLGASVVDPGAMLAPGSVIDAGGAVTPSGTAANGYSVVAAHDLDDALAKAKGCPVLHTGGTVEVNECLAA